MNEKETIQNIFAMKTIAVVGLSPKEIRPSYGVAKYLQSVGYKIIPVNPGHPKILGFPCRNAFVFCHGTYRASICAVGSISWRSRPS